MTYVAFLRGINVGGHKPIKMEALRKAFLALGLQNVRTILASGNVLFETRRGNAATLVAKIEEKLKQAFGHEIGVLLRTTEELQKLSDEKPFVHVAVTLQTRLYVTFLSEKAKKGLAVPATSPDGSFTIIRISGGEVCGVVILSPKTGTTDAMKVLEKEFGRKITTRNWNTITKILNGK